MAGHHALDSAMLTDIAGQLNGQITLSNDLMAQVQALQQQHMALQRQASDKQQQLRQAVSVAEASRAESADMKRKLAVSQDVTSKLTDELKSSKVEIGTLRRAVEGLERFSMEKRAEVTALANARDTAAGEADFLRAELREALRSAREAQEDADERIAALSEAGAKLAGDVADARARQAPLHAEVEAARAAAARLGEELDAVKRARVDLSTRLERALTACAAAEASGRESSAGEARHARALEEAQARVDSVAAVAAAAQDALRERDSELAAANARLASALAETRQAREDAVRSASEAATLTSELDASLAARASDRDASDERLARALDDVRRIADEARAREAAHASDAGRRAEEVISARHEAEVAMERAAEECNALGEVLTRVRSDAAAAARSWDSARGVLEKRLAEASNRLALAETEASRDAAMMRTRAAAADAEIVRMRDEQREESERHATLLGDLHASLRRLAGDFSAVVADREALAGMVMRLAGHIDELAGPEGPSANALAAWFGEAKRTFLVLVDRVQGERKRADGERENTRAAEVTSEELRARVLMQEDALSRAEHEATSRGAMLKEAQADLVAREEAAAKELRAAGGVATELQAELGRLKEKLAAANKGRSAAQSSAAQAAADAADADARAVARISSLDAQLSGLQTALRSSQVQVDDLTSREASLSVSLTEAGSELDRLRRERSVLSDSLDRAGEAARAASGVHAAQLSALTDSLRALDRQSKGSQAMLQQSREQVAALEAANIQLRGELDALYSNALRGGGGTGGGSSGLGREWSGSASGAAWGSSSSSGGGLPTPRGGVVL